MKVFNVVVVASLLMSRGQLVRAGRVTAQEEQQQQQPVSLKEFGTDLPECAYTCISPVLNNLGFYNMRSSNLAPLLCSDLNSMRKISACLQTTCTYPDLIIAFPFQKSLCRHQPTPSRAQYIQILTITMALLASVFVLLRVYSRVWVMKRFWWDDWDMLVAAILMVTIAVLMIWDSTIGLGLHTWDVPVSNHAKIAKIFLIMKLIYVLVQVLLKLSILLFYLRCFPSTPWLQTCTWILITLTFLHGIAFFFAILFQCTPISFGWNPRLSEAGKGGSCIELMHIIFPGAILAVAEDLAILLLPIPCISKLKVGRGKRFSVAVMFGVGFLATLVSILRAPHVWVFRDGLDQSWDTIDLLAWSEAELTVATICVCLPSVKPILNKHFPKYFSSASTTHYLGEIEPRAMLITGSNADSGTTSTTFEQRKGSVQVGINEIIRETSGDGRRDRQEGGMEKLKDSKMERSKEMKDGPIIGIEISRPEKVRLVKMGKKDFDFSLSTTHTSGEGLELSSFGTKEIIPMNTNKPLVSLNTAGGTEPTTTTTTFPSRTQTGLQDRPPQLPLINLTKPRYGTINSTRLLNQPQKATQVIIGKREKPLIVKEISRNSNATTMATLATTAATQKSEPEQQAVQLQTTREMSSKEEGRKSRLLLGKLDEPLSMSLSMSRLDLESRRRVGLKDVKDVENAKEAKFVSMGKKKRSDRYEVIDERGFLKSPTFLIMDD